MQLDSYQLEGQQLCNAGLDIHAADQGHWSRVLSYWRAMRQAVRRNGDCGWCHLNRRWTNAAGQLVCIHTGQPCVVDRVVPIANLWSIVNGVKQHDAS